MSNLLKIILIGVIILGIPLSVKLVQQQQILKSKAADVDAAACEEARKWMSTQAAVWKTATCQEIQSAVCSSGSTLFTASGTTNGLTMTNQEIRTALCSNYVPPAPLPAPPAEWNLPAWSTMRSNLDSWGGQIYNSTGKWPSQTQWLQQIQQQMPSAPTSFALAALDYFNAYNQKWGYMFPTFDPLPDIFKKWQEAPASTITASPNPCTVVSGATVCSSTISWNTSYVGHPTVCVNGSLFASSPSGSSNAPWISPNTNYDFVLHDAPDANSCSGTVIDSVTVTANGATPTGTISANPNPCTIASGASTCSSTISWDTINASHGNVCVNSDNQGNTIFASNPNGSKGAPWIAPGHSYVFTLFNAPDANSCSGTTIDSVTVTATTAVGGPPPTAPPTAPPSSPPNAPPSSLPGAPTCSAFLPNGLPASSEIGPGGIKIFTTSDFKGGRRLLDVTRSPADAVIKPSFTKSSGAGDLQFEPAVDGSGNWVVNIPDNNSTTADSDYTLSASVSSGGASQNCTPFMIRVPKMPADTSCPADISSTQARMRVNSTDAWTTDLTVNLGDTISVAGFYNQQTDNLASDIVLTATGPDGPKSHIVTLNNNNNDVSYKPTLAGHYTITASKVAAIGSKCTGIANLTVNTLGVTTSSFRIAESPADFAETGPYGWKDYTSTPMKITFEFKDTTPGLKNIWVEFKDSNGKPFGRKNVQIKLLGPDPVITSCALSFEANNTTVLNLKGTNFGTQKGTIKSNETPLTAREWKDTSIKAVFPNAPEGEKLPVFLTNTDGQKAEGQCSAISQIALGAKVFCRAPSQHQTNNVDLSLAGAFDGGKLIKQKVSIDADGVILGLTQKLEEDKAYNLSLKAPRGLRETVTFTAGSGTTNIPDFILPIGDIFPADGGDCTINNFDKSELNRQWIIAQDASGRTADFNKDNRVNSIDWACMRYDFNSTCDKEAQAGPTASGSATINQ